MNHLRAAMVRVRRAVAHFFVEHPWIAVAACAAVAAVLGFAGINGYYQRMGKGGWPNGIEPTAGDVLYRTLQLFIWESGGEFVGRQVGADLQVARLLAPAALAWAAVLAFARIFVNEWHAMRARLCSGHVIVCGLGRRGLLYAERLHEDGWTVVTIERDAGNPWIAQARRIGPVLVGDAADARVLARAGASRAVHLIAVCRDDTVNVGIAARAEALRARPSGKPVLTCHVHILEDAVWHAIREGELAPAPDRVRLHFVNPHDRAARLLFEDCLGLRRGPDGSSALLLVGGSPLLEFLILHAARAWSIDGRGRLGITVAAPDASEIVARLLMRHPALDRTAHLTARDVAIDATGFVHGSVVAEVASGGAPVTAVVCLPRAGQAVAVGVRLFHGLQPVAGRVIVCVAEDAGLFTLVRGRGAGALAAEDFVLFPVIDRICRSSLLLKSTNELLARAIHDSYRSHQFLKGQTAATNLALVAWDELDERLKESNRRQADDLGRKLEAVACTIAPLDGVCVPAFEFTGDEIERLAQLEHARWVRERQGAGWRHATGPKSGHTHPYLVEWDALPPDVKEVDRRAVREIPTLAARAGFQIYRRSPQSQATRPDPGLRREKSITT